ncbi:O-antigen ligase family protein [Hoeflea ulvae]|uniref:O-antigen ligase family protein n=1 Tax=Hoeflea ulvae TaxID=2983764 RepID=A0ABT3YFC0_9HYPH|nr:O-antigen ligase [Hoeflea ulvae]MCY0094573.1 O-antigen ligase family protein [Hoeflea ulvae]
MRQPALSVRLVRGLAITLSALGLALMLISLQPFAIESMVNEAVATEGSLVNQVGFLAAGLVFALAMLSMVSRRVLASLLSPSLLLLCVVLGYNVATAPDSDTTLRAVVFTVIGMFIAFSTIVLPRGEKDFQIALMLGATAALAMSYGGLVLAPGLATHGYDVYEPQHAGLWRGHFSHKNVAGPVMCIIAIFGVYLMRSGHRLAGLIIFVAATVFVLQTGSKTTSGFFPLSILIVFMASLFGRSSAAILVHLAALAAVGLLTLGSLYSQELSSLAAALLTDETYTGRTTLWAFGLSKIPEQPWLGYGLYNFWGTDTVFLLDKPFESAWDYRFIVHGHNNYVDILLNLGVIGGSVVIWFLFIGPMFNYAKARRIPGNARLADMFFMIIVFASLLSFLETFFLARNSALWLMHVLAVFGLQLLARFSMGNPFAGRTAPSARQDWAAVSARRAA